MNAAKGSSHSAHAKHDSKKMMDDRIHEKKMRLFSTVCIPTRMLLHVDYEASYSITDARVAILQTDIIRYYYKDIIGRCKTMHCGDTVVTDGTACVGGNVFEFSRAFGKVNAVETDETRMQMLQHNVRLLNMKNVNFYHTDITGPITHEIKQDIIFLDPPWGGLGYEKIERLQLFLSGKPLRQVCIDLAPKTKLIALKLPFNFDFVHFFEGSPPPFQQMYRCKIGFDRNQRAYQEYIDHNSRLTRKFTLLLVLATFP